jgi:hypothetical protein
MKKLFLLPIFLCLTAISIAQNNETKANDFERVALNVFVPYNDNLTPEAKNLVESKLRQIASKYGVGGSNESNPRFVLTSTFNILMKEQVSEGQLTVVQAEVVYYIADALENKIFSTISKTFKGSGSTEGKAYIDVFKKMQTRDPELGNFIEEGKRKIIQTYNDQCDFVLKDAAALDKQGLFDEAIAKLMMIPDVCKECYFKCSDQIEIVYQHKVDKECLVKIREAKAKWASTQNREGAEAVADILSNISPFSVCEPDVSNIMKSITAKLKADEQQAYNLKIKKYNDAILMKKQIFENNQKNQDRKFELEKLKTTSVIQLQKSEQKMNYEADKADREATGVKGIIVAFKRTLMANEVSKQMSSLRSKINYASLKL